MKCILLNININLKYYIGSNKKANIGLNNFVTLLKYHIIDIKYTFIISSTKISYCYYFLKIYLIHM